MRLGWIPCLPDFRDYAVAASAQKVEIIAGAAKPLLAMPSAY